MNKNMEDLLKKAESDSAVAKKIEEAKQKYIKELISLAKEVGITLVEEDFLNDASTLTDEEIENATGGIGYEVVNKGRYGTRFI